MYLGVSNESERQYRTDGWWEGMKYHPPIVEVVIVDRHLYRCDECGRISKVIEKAEEPFFCRCNHLISLKEGGNQ